MHCLIRFSYHFSWCGYFRTSSYLCDAFLCYSFYFTSLCWLETLDSIAREGEITIESMAFPMLSICVSHQYLSMNYVIWVAPCHVWCVLPSGMCTSLLYYAFLICPFIALKCCGTSLTLVFEKEGKKESGSYLSIGDIETSIVLLV